MKFYQKHKRLSMALTFAFFIFTGACGFPIYNLSREWSTMLTISIVLLGVSLYSSIGASEAVMFPNCKLCHILLLNLCSGPVKTTILGPAKTTNFSPTKTTNPRKKRSQPSLGM